MGLSPGTRLGPYEITAQIGVGGMGEVYRATDTNLKRAVAIKVLPDAIAHDPERVARFEREARTLATLNHPNIAIVHGFEKGDSVRALVMELVEGPSLADRLAQGALPVDEALPIAKQIAEALEAAHEQGIIHRDLKPANIKVREDGTVKVLDFGLAKAMEPAAGSSPSASMSPTITTPAMTQAGTILGTAAYMSPEQAKGRTVDKRSDLWAFGCVLYEMLTGRRALDGEDVSETLATVLRGEPDWTALPGDVSPLTVALIRRCLRKDIKKRTRDAGDIVLELEEALSTPATPAAAAATGAPVLSRRSLVVGLAGLLLGGFITGLAVWRLKPAPTAPIIRSTINLPPEQRLVTDLTTITLSPDGKRLAYAASASGQQQLYLLEMDAWEGKPIAGTEGALNPFFSPDGQWLGFFTVDRLMKVSISGGAPVLLARVQQQGRGGSWGSDGNIVFAYRSDSGLSVVSKDGGTVGSLTELDRQKGEGSHRFPHHLPGDGALLFTVGTGGSWDDARIELLKLGSGERKVLLEGGSDARYVPTGHLVYLRAGTLMAVPFDLGRFEITGDRVELVQGVLPSTGNSGAAQVAFADAGASVYLSGDGRAGERTLVWVDRKGAEEPLPLPPGGYQHPNLSPNGQRVVLNIDRGNSSQVWVYDLRRGFLDPITVENHNSFPIWTSDDKVTYVSNKAGGRRNLFWKTADSSSSEEQLAASENPQVPGSWSPNGQTLAFFENDPATGLDIWTLSLDNRGKPELLVRTPSREGNAAFSPDGHWIAYTSNKSGQDEVYVQSFPGKDSGPRVSTQGGREPVWSRDGRELFYRSGDKMMAVATTFEPKFDPPKAEVLFERRYSRTTPRNYDVHPDGRFLMLKESEVEATHINLVLNWTEELKRLVPTR
jgi:Tol biopolymer transport system component